MKLGGATVIYGIRGVDRCSLSLTFEIMQKILHM